MASSIDSTENATERTTNATNNPCAKVMKPSDNRPDNELGSISEVDLEELNGGQRKTNWRDARELRAGRTPTLEDGAD
jgi:hypothetical protein